MPEFAVGATATRNETLLPYVVVLAAEMATVVVDDVLPIVAVLY
ncbi:MAG: hypothetical protein ACLPKH_07525 [Rhodomicrobium sp.]